MRPRTNKRQRLRARNIKIKRNTLRTSELTFTFSSPAKTEEAKRAGKNEIKQKKRNVADHKGNKGAANPNRAREKASRRNRE